MTMTMSPDVLTMEHKPSGTYAVRSATAQPGWRQDTTWQWEIKGQYGEIGEPTGRTCATCREDILEGECMVQAGYSHREHQWHHLRCEPEATSGAHHPWTDAAKRTAFGMNRAHKMTTLADAVRSDRFKIEVSPFLADYVVAWQMGATTVPKLMEVRAHREQGRGASRAERDGGGTTRERATHVKALLAGGGDVIVAKAIAGQLRLPLDTMAA
jgi:hypothetical protein